MAKAVLKQPDIGRHTDPPVQPPESSFLGAKSKRAPADEPRRDLRGGQAPGRTLHPLCSQLFPESPHLKLVHKQHRLLLKQSQKKFGKISLWASCPPPGGFSLATHKLQVELAPGACSRDLPWRPSPSNPAVKWRGFHGPSSPIGPFHCSARVWASGIRRPHIDCLGITFSNPSGRFSHSASKKPWLNSPTSVLLFLAGLLLSSLYHG